MKRSMLVCLSVLLCFCLFAPTVYAIEDELYTEKSFTHNILDRNGILICKLNTKVTGYYSYVGKYSEIISIKCSLSNQAFSGLTVTTSKSGNKGYAYVKLYGSTIVTFRYTLNYNGGITVSIY